MNKVIANEGRLTLALTHEKTEQARNLSADGLRVGQETGTKIDVVWENIQALTLTVEANARAVIEGSTRQVNRRLVENV